MLRRSRLVPALTALVALVAAGCEPAVNDHRATQDLNEPVEIATSLCPGNGSTGTPGDTTSCSWNSGSLADSQVLAGYRVPEGSELVSSAISRMPEIDQELTRDPTLEAYLESIDPAGAGLDRVGVRTARIDFSDVRALHPHLVTVFDPPASGDAASSFPHATWLANRTVSDDLEAAAPVDCSSGCKEIDKLAGVSFEGVLALRELRSLGAPAGPVSVVRGAKATVPFTAAYVGDAPSGALFTELSSSLPVQSDVSRLTFDSTGTQTVTATVDVPDDAPLGIHDVKLTVDVPGGTDRQVTGKVDVKDKAVAPAAPAAPAVSLPAGPTASGPGTPTTTQVKDSLMALKLRSVKRSSVLRDGLRFRQPFALAGRATWELRSQGEVLGKLTRRIAGPGFQRMTLRLSKTGQQSLGARRIPALALRTTYVDALGRRVSVTMPVRLR